MRKSRWRVALGVLVVVIPLLVAALPAGAAPSGTGSISGRVVDGDGNPVSGICAQVENGPQVQTDALGKYTIPDLDAGSYKVGFTDCNPTPKYVEQWYSGHPDATSADAVVVMDGMATPLGDVTLAEGVTVTGTVTDTNGAPLSGITVNLSPTNPGPTKVGVQTDADGNYTTAPTTPGTYKVAFLDQSPTPVWAPQYWKQEPSFNTAATLTLSTANGPVQAGVNARLTTGATIEGTVRGPGGAALGGVCVDANTPANNGSDWIAGTVTNPDGSYRIGQLPATDIRVHFRDCTSGPYLDQWYSGAGYDTSTPVVLAAGDDRTGIDAQLTEGTVVSGLVTDAHGNPIAGISVNVNPTGNGGSGWAQTDPTGHYQTSAVAPGSYRVQFQDNSSQVWAAQYWNNAATPSTATDLNVTGADSQISDIDATLARGATVTGRATAAGAPAGNVCVSAEADNGNGTDYISGATTAPDGTYTIAGLPATPLLIHFRNCDESGSYIEQWWDHASTSGSATALTLTPGTTRSGIDAQLSIAGQIKGTVTDRAGNPLPGICAQATTSTFVGGLARTNDHGQYTIDVDRGGSYRVQFVDCSGSPKYAGQWWNGQNDAGAAQTVNLAAGHVVGHIDAKLAKGAVGTISGQVVNLHGTAMTSVCVIAYLPNQFALFGMVQSDGTYTIPDVPSGTYALAFLGCGGGGDPSPIVPDPQSSITSYPAAWWNGPLVDVDKQGDGPDPIAQGATLVTVKPGHDLAGYDWCFGCTAVTITSVTPGPGSLKVAFTTPGLVPTVGASSVSASARTTRSYTVTCTSSNGGVTGHATGSASPITVTGLTPGASYTCQVTAADGSQAVGASVRSVSVTASVSGEVPVADPSVTPTASGATGATTASAPSSFPTAAATATMARTGTDSEDQAGFGATLLALGLALVLIGRTRKGCRATRAST